MIQSIETFILLAEAVASLFVLIGGLWAVFKFIQKQKEQDEKISESKKEVTDMKKEINEELASLKTEINKELAYIREEQQAMLFALFAALDGLIQGGANGKVKEEYSMLEKHLNKAAHRR